MLVRYRFHFRDERGNTSYCGAWRDVVGIALDAELTALSNSLAALSGASHYAIDVRHYTPIVHGVPATGSSVDTGQSAYYQDIDEVGYQLWLPGVADSADLTLLHGVVLAGGWATMLGGNLVVVKGTQPYVR